MDVEQLDIDVKFMMEALKEAQAALEEDEVPIGCVIVAPEAGGGRIIARAHNLTQMLKDPTAHAEMQAITSATAYLQAKYLPECTLYVTVEPCAMCASALAWAQIKRVVYGCQDPKRGAGLYAKLSDSAAKQPHSTLYHPKTEVVGGILAPQCAAFIQDFFKAKR